MFRNYESFGYITDNRNFGYKQTGNNENFIGDKILSDIGAVFMSVLSRKPQTFDELVQKMQLQFQDVDYCTIENDAKEFYCALEQDGFIVSGETVSECEEKDTKFSYKQLATDVADRDFISTIVRPDKSTQDFFQEYFNGKPQLTSLHIEIISKCNERCIHCYIPHDEKISYLEPDLFYNVLEQCKDMKVLHLTLSGGEPMLHKNFIDFLRKCRESDFSVNVLSNLTLLTEEIIEEMKANSLLGVQVSLYSMDSTVHDGITQMKGSLERTKNAILRLLENDIPVQISCPIMKQNKDSYHEVAQWAKKHKIHVGDDYGIIGSYDHTSQNLSCRLSINDIADLIANKVSQDSKYIEQLETEAEKKKNMTTDDFVCSVCHSSICIKDNGNVYPCAGWQDYIVGNVKETSLNDIWETSSKVQYLRNLRKRDFPKCVQCPDKLYCTMCMVRNANENSLGDPLIVNEFFCDIARLNKKVALGWIENQVDINDPLAVASYDS